MPRKRPSLKDVASTLNASVPQAAEVEPTVPQEAALRPAQQPTEPETVEWKKFTAPYRQDQLDQLRDVLDEWAYKKKVKFSIAEVLRLGLDEILRQMGEEPDEVILKLHRQEQRETSVNDNRKFGRSRGAEEYLRQAGKL